MKKQQLIFLIVALLATFSLAAQAPQLINYQGLALDNSGNTLPNQNISLRLSILDGSATGTALYEETHSTTTNGLGVFNVLIGGGIASMGTMNAIDWGVASRFLKVEMDTNGGNSYQLMGSSQLVSVPYALYAEHVNPANLSVSNNDFDYAFDIMLDTIQLIAQNISSQTVLTKLNWQRGEEWEDISIQVGALPNGIWVNDTIKTLRFNHLGGNISFIFNAGCNANVGVYTVSLIATSLKTGKSKIKNLVIQITAPSTITPFTLNTLSYWDSPRPDPSGVCAFDSSIVRMADPFDNFRNLVRPDTIPNQGVISNAVFGYFELKNPQPPNPVHGDVVVMSDFVFTFDPLAHNNCLTPIPITIPTQSLTFRPNGYNITFNSFVTTPPNSAVISGSGTITYANNNIQKPVVNFQLTITDSNGDICSYSNSIRNYNY